MFRSSKNASKLIFVPDNSSINQTIVLKSYRIVLLKVYAQSLLLYELEYNWYSTFKVVFYMFVHMRDSKNISADNINKSNAYGI